MAKLSPAAVAEIAEQLSAAPRGQKTALVELYAERLGCSARNVWTVLRAHRGATRKPRSDRKKTSVPEKDVLVLEGYKLKTLQRTGGQVPTHQALRYLMDRGEISNGLTVSTANRIIRQRRVITERAYARFEANSPNDLHHVDFSGSEFFRPVFRDGEWFAEVRPRPLRGDEKVERGDMGMRLWVLSLIDDHSRIMRAEYVISPGESAIALIPFLQAAWARQEGDPFCGLPKAVISDNGPAFRSTAFHAMVRAIDEGLRREGLEGMSWQPRSAYDKQVGGKVERPYRTIWSSFERVFVADHEGAQIPMDTLAGLFSSWVAEQNERSHPTYRKLSCMQVWRRSTASIREVPPDLLSLTFHRDVRTVTRDGCIHFQDEVLRVGGDLAGLKVEVLWNFKGEVYAKTPWGESIDLRSAGSTFSWPRKEKIEAEKAALATRQKGGPLPQFGSASSGVRKVAYFPVAGEEVEPVTAIGDPVYASADEARFEICRIVNCPHPQMPAQIQALVDDEISRTLSVEQLNSFARNLRDQVDDLDQRAESG